VKILLRQDDINPNKPDEFGQTPPCHTAENGHEEVVKVLIGCGDVSLDKPKEWDQTPLHCAARNRD